MKDHKNSQIYKRQRYKKYTQWAEEKEKNTAKEQKTEHTSGLHIEKKIKKVTLKK